jgi:hypothetical protein
MRFRTFKRAIKRPESRDSSTFHFLFLLCVSNLCILPKIDPEDALC